MAHHLKDIFSNEGREILKNGIANVIYPDQPFQRRHIKTLGWARLTHKRSRSREDSLPQGDTNRNGARGIELVKCGEMYFGYVRDRTAS
jgi:hypothetical protein